MVLITEDADRTMGTYLGAASTLSPEGVPAAFVARASIVLLEGYLWDVPAAKEAMRHAAATAHAAEGSVALSLSDPFCVGRHQREFLDLLLDDVDILLGNEEEITMLFGVHSYKGALQAAEETGLLVVMTRGAQGATVLTARGPEEVPAAPVHQVVDTDRRRGPVRRGLPLRPDPRHGTRSRAPAWAACAPPRSSRTRAPGPRPISRPWPPTPASCRASRPAREPFHRHRRTAQRGQVHPLQRADQQRGAGGELSLRHH